MTRLRTIPGEPTSEAELRHQIQSLLESNGYLVRATSDNRKTRSQLKSLSDLMIRSKKWSPGTWLCVEVKFGAGKWHWSSEEQERSNDDGDIVTWFWLQDAREFIFEDTGVMPMVQGELTNV